MIQNHPSDRNLMKKEALLSRPTLFMVKQKPVSVSVPFSVGFVYVIDDDQTLSFMFHHRSDRANCYD